MTSKSTFPSVWPRHIIAIQLLNAIRTDIYAAFDKDPAARSLLEVLTCYPGLQAIAIYRIAHLLHQHHFFWLARFLSHIARWLTGIEIHPGATLGAGIFIDHGMGVVIGETAIVGDGALIYQGVTLGGTGKQKGKRHPTLGNQVVVGAGALVLGDIEIGHNTRIGAGSVVLRSVPSDCTVVGVPGQVVNQSGVRINPLAHNQVPDPLANMLRHLTERLDALEDSIDTLKNSPEPSLTVTYP
jgi:serine O-acetyltransferase